MIFQKKANRTIFRSVISFSFLVPEWQSFHADNSQDGYANGFNLHILARH